MNKISEVFELKEIKKIIETIIAKNYGNTKTGPDSSGFNGVSFEDSITDLNVVLKPLGLSLMLINHAKSKRDYFDNVIFKISLSQSNSCTLEELFKEFKSEDSFYWNSDVILCSVSETNYNVIDAASLKTCASKWMILSNDANGVEYAKNKKNNKEEDSSKDFVNYELSLDSNKSGDLKTGLGQILLVDLDDTNKKAVSVKVYKFDSNLENIIETLKNEKSFEKIEDEKKISFKIKSPVTNKKKIVLEFYNRENVNDSSKPTSWSRGVKVHKEIIDKICTLIHQFNFDGVKEIRDSITRRDNGEY